MAAAAVGISPSSSHLSSTIRHKHLRMNGGTTRNRSSRVGFVSASSRTGFADPYDTLSVRRDASESEVKKAFRRLALQYHPDVCKEDNCNVQFYQINEAYDMVMSSLRGEATIQQEEANCDSDDSFRGMHDSEWDMWEEWMGWEGAGIRDYTSHINPYI
ncbi:chaperone protein dnaJ 8, chloroplastic [Silene latifolia]|uniref:chaperone protein dnaJ 8, chloroplastic n=1 Tax=Silene latifolia TaxID=37657 RepID=UPI003D774B11